ncbi:uncharacterized protein MELLADRAFT_58859 [Melampsora larici-populina 98AG31]|uniref:Uncharacterized protein n=1 Tax=Melampsora larici-populina (strain 98AG31 / pathotype 3-4-7) TaxID=747676 RepID=F4R672_MELLP|nr:uncharacterized protein MELLADRAFT_58859 [Melampsora larici-populina 98AG31]EGG12518.1 hypothetical protein MELLADRAFT_58859 [Melampsora larici-populina 98AG31]
MTLFVNHTRIGVIPCQKDDPRVIAEEAREKAEGFPKCECSNCNPEAAAMLVHNLPKLTKLNYMDAMTNVSEVEGFFKPNKDESEQAGVGNGQGISNKKGWRKRCGPLDPALEELADELVFMFELHCNELFGDDGYCESEDYFGLERATKIVEIIEDVKCSEDIEDAMGGDIIEGGVDVVFDYINEWRTRDTGIEFLRKREIIREKKKQDEDKTLKEKNTINIIPKVIASFPLQKKQRRTSEQVKADKEAATHRREYNQRCINWMKFDHVPSNKLDAKERAYQEK